MGILLAFPVLIGSIMLQMAFFSRLPMLHGTCDLVLLVLIAWGLQDNVPSAWEWALIGGFLVSMTSAMPLFLPLIVYLMVMALVRVLRSKVWQVPVLAMFVAVVIATIVQHVFSIVVLQYINETSLVWGESLRLVTMPSVLFNIILSLPVYIVMHDLAEWVYPVEVTV